MRDTIDMARESWIDVYGLGHDRAKFIEALKHFEALVRADAIANAVADEREACARVCEDVGSTLDEFLFGSTLAGYIRARRDLS